ncbi:MAG TPA: sugar transferase [Chloroflexota bacterium]|nr:sugar transferase [Chloroflexota bacterium]
MAAEQSMPARARSGDLVASTTRSRGSWSLFMAWLVAIDAGALALAFALAYLIRFKAGLPFLLMPPHQIEFYSSIGFWMVPVWLAVFALYRLYDRHHIFIGFQEYTRAIHACTVGIVVLIVVSFLDTTLNISRGWLVLTWCLSILFVVGLRFSNRRFLRHLRRRGFFTTPTVIVGANEEATALADQFLADPSSGTRVLGFIDDTFPVGTPVRGNLRNLAGLTRFEDAIRAWGVREIVIATTAVTRNQLLDLYRTLGHDQDVELRLSSGLFEILTTGVRVQEVSCIPLMTPQRVRITDIDAFLKLSLDYVGAAVALVLLSPLFLVIALLIKRDSPGPVFHLRRVLGRSEKPFEALKFRTMVVNADEILATDATLREAFKRDYKLKSDPRVTRLGGLLRRTSLDELPQLINVLRGEMSLVGPRMITPEEASRYGKWRLNLLTVKPGITGPWQVEGRSEVPYDERVRLSMHYIRNYSIWLDLGILLRTIPSVLLGRGAY